MSLSDKIKNVFQGEQHTEAAEKGEVDKSTPGSYPHTSTNDIPRTSTHPDTFSSGGGTSEAASPVSPIFDHSSDEKPGTAVSHGYTTTGVGLNPLAYDPHAQFPDLKAEDHQVPTENAQFGDSTSKLDAKDVESDKPSQPSSIAEAIQQHHNIVSNGRGKSNALRDETYWGDLPAGQQQQKRHSQEQQEQQQKGRQEKEQDPGTAYNTVIGHGSDESATASHRPLPHASQESSTATSTTTINFSRPAPATHDQDNNLPQGAGVYNTVIGHGSDEQDLEAKPARGSLEDANALADDSSSTRGLCAFPLETPDSASTPQLGHERKQSGLETEEDRYAKDIHTKETVAESAAAAGAGGLAYKSLRKSKTPEKSNDAAVAPPPKYEEEFGTHEKHDKHDEKDDSGSGGVGGLVHRLFHRKKSDDKDDEKDDDDSENHSTLGGLFHRKKSVAEKTDNDSDDKHTLGGIFHRKKSEDKVDDTSDKHTTGGGLFHRKKDEDRVEHAAPAAAPATTPNKLQKEPKPRRKSESHKHATKEDAAAGAADAGISHKLFHRAGTNDGKEADIVSKQNMSNYQTEQDQAKEAPRSQFAGGHLTNLNAKEVAAPPPPSTSAKRSASATVPGSKPSASPKTSPAHDDAPVPAVAAARSAWVGSPTEDTSKHGSSEKDNNIPKTTAALALATAGAGAAYGASYAGGPPAPFDKSRDVDIHTRPGANEYMPLTGDQPGEPVVVPTPFGRGVPEKTKEESSGHGSGSGHSTGKSHSTEKVLTGVAAGAGAGYGASKLSDNKQKENDVVKHNSGKNQQSSGMIDPAGTTATPFGRSLPEQEGAENQSSSKNQQNAGMIDPAGTTATPFGRSLPEQDGAEKQSSSKTQQSSGMIDPAGTTATPFGRSMPDSAAASTEKQNPSKIQQSTKPIDSASTATTPFGRSIPESKTVSAEKLLAGVAAGSAVSAAIAADRNGDEKKKKTDALEAPSSELPSVAAHTDKTAPTIDIEGETDANHDNSDGYNHLKSGTSSGIEVDADDAKSAKSAASSSVTESANTGAYNLLHSGTPSGVAIPPAARKSHDSSKSQGSTQQQRAQAADETGKVSKSDSVKAVNAGASSRGNAGDRFNMVELGESAK